MRKLRHKEIKEFAKGVQLGTGSAKTRDQAG